MRTRLPAVLLLLLSWFLPAGAQVTTVHAAAVQRIASAGPSQQAPCAAAVAGPHTPRTWVVPAPHQQLARYTHHDAISGQAVLAAGPPDTPPAWSIARRWPTIDAHADHGQVAPAARAPPSTTG